MHKHLLENELIKKDIRELKQAQGKKRKSGGGGEGIELTYCKKSTVDFLAGCDCQQKCHNFMLQIQLIIKHIYK